MKISFETPKIVGALCENEDDIPAQMRRRFAKFGKRIAFLPFSVERRHLKNTLACMKLMDVAGLMICGKHRASIAKHIADLDEGARRTGRVDCIVRRGKRFVGIDIIGAMMSQKGDAPSRTNLARDVKRLEKQILSDKKLMGYFCQTAVALLTEGLFKDNQL